MKIAWKFLSLSLHTDERGMAKMCLDWALYSVVMTIYEIEKEYFLDSFLLLQKTNTRNIKE